MKEKNEKEKKKNKKRTYSVGADDGNSFIRSIIISINHNKSNRNGNVVWQWWIYRSILGCECGGVEMHQDGYVEISTREFVSDEDAYLYALEQLHDEETNKDFIEKYLKPLLDSDDKEQKEFVEWFFSGNWIREENHRL